MVIPAVLLFCLAQLSHCQFYPYGNFNQNRRTQLQKLFNYNYYSRQNARRLLPTTKRTTTTTTTTTLRPSVLGEFGKQCGKRESGYRPDQRARRGRIVWTDEKSQGATAPPPGSFPWLASLFLRQTTGEAYFMCAATVLTPTVLVSAAHCFSDRYRDRDWFVRLGDNYMVTR